MGLKLENGYELKTTFWEDFTIAESFGVEAILDTFNRSFDNWKNNGQKGLFAMATGTGKTITSLNCLLEIYKRKGYYKAIILVPTITLVNCNRI